MYEKHTIGRTDLLTMKLSTEKKTNQIDSNEMPSNGKVLGYFGGQKTRSFEFITAGLQFYTFHFAPVSIYKIPSVS